MEDFPYIAILPWLAFGHMIPLLELSITLAEAGVRISYLCTLKNRRRLPKIPENLSHLIEFVELTLPAVDGLDHGAEATVDIPHEQYVYLAESYDHLKDQVKQFLQASSPDCLLIEFMSYWAISIGRECGVPCVYFSAFSAAGLTFFGPPESADEGHSWWRPSPKSLTSKPKWVPFGSAVGYLLEEAEAFYPPFFTQYAGKMRLVERHAIAIAGCDSVAIRSCDEIEAEYVDLLRKLLRKPVILIGLLPPEKARTTSEHNRIFEWLNCRENKTVVFVSFGSEYKLTEREVHELAYGLELSGLQFLWALRRPFWLTGAVDKALPQGFTSRTEGRGIVELGWAPQKEILAHRAVAGCLFHSGWGSIAEMLSHGHVLIVLPTYFDQGLNARLMVEKGLAVEVEKGKDGPFDREKIAEALKTAMRSDEGEKLRLRSMEIGAAVADQARNERYIKGFTDYLVETCRKSC